MMLDFDAPLEPEDLPPGTKCLGAFRGADVKDYWDRTKLLLTFELIEPVAVAGLRVAAFMAHPGRRPSRRCKFYELWCKANGGPPKRGQRLAMKVFEGYWRFTIRWGERNGKPTIPVVDELLERVAGEPPRCR